MIATPASDQTVISTTTKKVKMQPMTEKTIEKSELICFTQLNEMRLQWILIFHMQ